VPLKLKKPPVMKALVPNGTPVMILASKLLRGKDRVPPEIGLDVKTPRKLTTAADAELTEASAMRPINKKAFLSIYIIPAVLVKVDQT
jgi:hypothetical protein